MHGLVNRWIVRIQDQKRRVALKASIRCESLEGRRLLSGGVDGGGFGGMGFGGGMGGGANMTQRGPGTAARSGFAGGIGSQNQNAGGFQNQGAPGVTTQNMGGPQSSQFVNSFANGRSGDNTPFRPYVGWQNDQVPNPTLNSNANPFMESTSSTHGSSSTTSTTNSSNSNPGDPSFVPTGFGFMNGGGPGFANNNGGGPGFANNNGGGPGFANNNGGGPGFANNNGGGGPGMVSNGGGFGRENGGFSHSNPFDLSSSDLSDVKKAIDALRTELKNDVPTDAKPSYASIGTLMDDLDAIRNGTLTGTDATTKVQTDEAAVLTELGVTSDQITAIQADEATLVTAVDAAISSASSSSSSTSSTDTHNPLQDMADVPLLPFLSQLRQNQPTNATSSTSSASSSSSSTTA